MHKYIENVFIRCFLNKERSSIKSIVLLDVFDFFFKFDLHETTWVYNIGQTRRNKITNADLKFIGIYAHLRMFFLHLFTFTISP